jgi:hypothetical protein
MVPKFLSFFKTKLIHPFAQKQSLKNRTEIYFFRADVCNCQDMDCNYLVDEVKKLIEAKFSGKRVNFKEIKLDEESNAGLIKKYRARSQTVILVSYIKGKETSKDISQIVKEYAFSNDFPKFEKEFTSAVKSSL